MPNNVPKKGLIAAVAVLADEAKKIVIQAATIVRTAVQAITSTRAMKLAGRATVTAFNLTVVETTKGVGDGLQNFSKLGFNPVHSVPGIMKFYANKANFNPFYILGNCIGAIVVTPPAVIARITADVGLGTFYGMIDAVDQKEQVINTIKKELLQGHYLAVPAYLLSYGITKPIEFTVRQLKDGIKLGYKVNFKGVGELIAQENNLAKKIPLALCTTAGFGLGLTAKGIKYPAEHTVKGFADGLTPMVDYLWFHKRNFVLKNLYDKSSSNVLHNAAMVPGAVVGLTLGHIFSTAYGVIYGVANGAIVGDNLFKAAKVLEVFGDLKPHQTVIMMPALACYTAGASVGFVTSLVTWPIHSANNAKQTGYAVAIPFVAPYYYGKKLFGGGKKNPAADITENSPSTLPREVVDCIAGTPVIATDLQISRPVLKIANSGNIKHTRLSVTFDSMANSQESLLPNSGTKRVVNH